MIHVKLTHSLACRKQLMRTPLMSGSQGSTLEQKWNTWGCPLLIPGTLLSILTGNLPLVLSLPSSPKKCQTGARLSLGLWQLPLLRLPWSVVCLSNPLPGQTFQKHKGCRSLLTALFLITLAWYWGASIAWLPLVGWPYVFLYFTSSISAVNAPGSLLPPAWPLLKKIFPSPLSAWTYGWDLWKW